jgi:hypothetical protein
VLLLVIVNLSSKASPFPTEALSDIDSALAAVGLRKQVRSVLVPGKEFAVTYDGPSIDKRQVEAVVSPLAERNGITFSVDVEESVSFP